MLLCFGASMNLLYRKYEEKEFRFPNPKHPKPAKKRSRLAASKRSELPKTETLVIFPGALWEFQVHQSPTTQSHLVMAVPKFKIFNLLKQAKFSHDLRAGFKSVYSLDKLYPNSTYDFSSKVEQQVSPEIAFSDICIQSMECFAGERCCLAVNRISRIYSHRFVDLFLHFFAFKNAISSSRLSFRRAADSLLPLFRSRRSKCE